MNQSGSRAEIEKLVRGIKLEYALKKVKATKSGPFSAAARLHRLQSATASAVDKLGPDSEAVFLRQVEEELAKICGEKAASSAAPAAPAEDDEEEDEEDSDDDEEARELFSQVYGDRVSSR